MRRSSHSRTPRRQQGMALLVCLFVVAVASALVVGILDTCAMQYGAARNSTDYEAAQYLAGAAVQHALAELEQDASWTTGLPATQFPMGSARTYSASVVPGAGSTVIVTGLGTAGTVTRRIEVTVSLGG